MPAPLHSWISGAVRDPSADHTTLDSSSEYGPGDDCDEDCGCGDDLG